MADSHTSEELINQAASILGKFVPGEALGPVEHDTIDSVIDDVLAEISSIVDVDRNDVPTRLFETIARLVAIYAAGKFSNQQPDLNVIYQHEQRLRFLVANKPTYEPLRAEYF